MVEYTAVEQEQGLLDEKDSVELYDITDHHNHRSTGLRGFLRSQPWITYAFLVYAVVSMSLLAWTSVCLHRLRYKPYCKFISVLSLHLQHHSNDIQRL